MIKTTIEEILKKLNPEQFAAAEALEGPVQVIAGPGTGKTQILASRIANILTKTDTDPWQILCLTFTEAGVVAMRKRLLQIIGPAAHQIQIHTFHSLCNQIIQENQNYFGSYRLAPIDDIETEAVMISICEQIQADSPLFNSYDIYTYKNALLSAFLTFKKENLSSKQIIEKMALASKELLTDEDMYYKRKSGNNVKGDLNIKKLNEAQKRLDKITEAAKLFDLYLEKLTQLQRYDFEDMILWVLDAFEKHEELLLNYQEKFLYVLTDEFQDTNGAQFALIQKLMAYWDQPNIFSVGDDDQSIYAFQGANVENMINFGKVFSNGLQEFVLTTNYRSTPEVVSVAETLIANNKERLINTRTNLSKDLKSNNQNGEHIQVIECNNPLQEASWILAQIEDKIKAGKKPNDIAILYNKHRLCIPILRLLQSKNIPVNIHKSDNIFDVSEIAFLIRALTYIQREMESPFSADDDLFKLLHAPFFGLNSVILAEKVYEIKKSNPKHELHLRKSFQASNANLFESAPIKNAMQMVESWIIYANNYSPIALLDKIVKDVKIVKFFEKPNEHHVTITALHALFQFIRDRNEKNQEYSLQHCVEELALLKQGKGINIINDIKSEEGVNFVSIHSSKGLEFDTVFVIGNTKQNWSSARGGGIDISLRPLFHTDDDENASKEEKRRLMYVAITRAENQLYLSYYTSNEAGKDQSESEFISEMLENEKVEKIIPIVNTNQLEANSIALIGNEELKITLAKTAYITKMLENYTLSATHLNAYLSCPISFYYQNLLRVPSVKNESACIGTAVHEAISIIHRSFGENGIFPDLGFLLKAFEQKMKNQYIYFNQKTFESKMEYGKNYLTTFYNNNIERWKSETVFKTEARFKVLLNNVPITGSLDKLVFNGNDITVIDYKTGNPDNAKKKMKPVVKDYQGEDLDKKYGGDYWRQLLFYYFLISEYKEKPWRMISGVISCVEKDRATQKAVEDIKLYPEADDLKWMEILITETYNNIIAGKFNVGCNDAEKCEWCALHQQIKR